VRSPRVVPPTTIAANQTLFADYKPPSFGSDYEEPRKRRWPWIVALSMLAAFALLTIGGVIAWAIMNTAWRAPTTQPQVAARATPMPTASIWTASPARRAVQIATPQLEVSEDVEARAEPTQATRRTVLLNQLFAIGPGQDRQFTITMRAAGRIQGQFTASGGLQNDIVVMLTSPTAILYNSGKTSVGVVDVAVDAGEYQLVFDNGYARVFGKKVGATFYAVH
jgi:hypothetical protein